jgi:glycosyltransferase involved in cell wall biosynthesis
MSEEMGFMKPEISVVIPAFNEGAVISSVIERIFDVLDQMELSREVIVINDGSDDDTEQKAKEAGASVISHPYNMGNGAAVKTGIRNAQGKIIVLLDGDGQHAPEDIPRLLEKMPLYDMVVGARTSDSAGSWHRNLANIFFNWFSSYMCGRKIEDLTSGFRAMKVEIARRFVYLLPNTFSYPTTITLAFIHSGYGLAYVPIKTYRRTGKSKIKLVKDGSFFLLTIIKIATLFSPMRVFLPVSAMMFFGGIGYGLFKIFILGERYGPTAAMLITMALVVFMVGLVSEQVAQLKFGKADYDGQDHQS